jgi:WhiB family transcriptional regulator, redox-sensing transcriptional regulator
MKFNIDEWSARMATIESLSQQRTSTEDWADLAVCKGRTTLFFPPRAERPQARARREAHARRLCDACPVQEPCKQFARSNHEYGFWGGESEEDRHIAGYTVAAPIGVRARAVHN